VQLGVILRKGERQWVRRAGQYGRRVKGRTIFTKNSNNGLRSNEKEVTYSTTKLGGGTNLRN